MTTGARFLVDGNNLAWRTWWIFKHLTTTSTNTPSGLEYGFFRTLWSLHNYFPSALFMVVFDHPIIHRRMTDSTYKPRGVEDEDRTEIYSRVDAMIPYLRALLPVYQTEGYEADDIIASLCTDPVSRTWLYSMDQDYMELVTESIHLVRPQPGTKIPFTVFTPTEVEQRYSVTPEKFAWYRAMTGDESDGVVGIKGVGPKWGSWLVNNFCIDDPHFLPLVSHLKVHGWSNSQQRFSSLLLENLELVKHNYQLVHRRGVRLDPQPQPIYQPNLELLREYFDTMDFRSLQLELESFVDCQEVARQVLLTEAAIHG